MLLLTKEIESRLRNAPTDNPNNKPLVKLFTPDAGATWLISEMLPDGDTMFGLCDLGLGCAELGYISLSELKTIRGNIGLPVERDRHFKADKTLAEYASEAYEQGRIVA